VIRVAERLELERVSARIEEEQRRLLGRLAFEAQPRRNDEPAAGGGEPRRERLESVPVEDP
jgi:hypothetical protein